MDRRKRIVALCLAVGAVVLFLLPEDRDKHYYRNEGKVFGTYYSVSYEGYYDLHDSIRDAMREVDETLSMFNKYSLVARLNRGADPELPLLFRQVFNTAQQVSELTDGAFDITVAPLVNAWGFGFKNKEQVTAEVIDSLLGLVGYRYLHLEGRHLKKAKEGVMIDASAIAKGFACDRVAAVLRRNDAENLLVDIGGEVVAQGMNSKGEPWSIGITKPIDDISGTVQQLQDVLHTSDACMASSGNYRNFYYENGVRRSHTIDPRTGYPVHHSLLSATVIAPSCMLADALATSCMVLGTDSALALISRVPDAACYLIEASADTLRVRKSDNWPASDTCPVSDNCPARRDGMHTVSQKEKP